MVPELTKYPERFAVDLALDSARISGYEPGEGGDDILGMHCALMQIIVNGPGKLIHPIVLNMELCGDRSIKLRRGMPAGQHGQLPHGRYTHALLILWWWHTQRMLRAFEESGSHTPATRLRFCRVMHDHLYAIHPFTKANGRTARLVYYMLQRACGLDIHPIRYDDAEAYLAHCEKRTQETFVPAMRKHGYVAALG